MKIQATNVFERNHQELQNKTRLIVNQGGRGSSKTWSIAQIFLILLLTKKDILLTVARKYLPALRATAMKDFFDIMRNEGLYKQESHNKTELTYRFRTNEIEFISVDQPQKVRGRKRQYLWMNEANEFSLEDYRQLSMRTEGSIFMDFNPSDEFHWIYDHVLTRNDTKLIQSTYLDNPFLPQSIVKEIESYQKLDQNYWRVYGLGERGVSQSKVYSHWNLCDKLPDGEIIYGLDFGFNNPTALVKIVTKDNEYYWDEVIYESHLNNNDLVEKLKALSVPKTNYIYADTEDPSAIDLLKKAGYNVKPASKEKDSVIAGIKQIKSHAFHITKSSVNILKEVKSYSWKTKDDRVLDEPVKTSDHALDAGRYAIYTHAKKVEPSLYVV